MTYNRRQFVAGSAAVAAGASPLPAQALADIPIIDCHIHLFDARRPQGAPYKGGRSFPGGVALPSMYAPIAAPLGIVGVIHVDASPWVEDNLWILETIQDAPLMVGMIGNLRLEGPEFGAMLDRYAKNPLFRGIRYGNLWGYDLPGQVNNPDVVAGLRRLAQHDLVLETANQNLALLWAAVRASDQAPDLRIVVDHLPAFDPQPEEAGEYRAVLKEIAARRNIFCKLSEIVHPRRPASVPPVIVRDLAALRPGLDVLMECFGEDRVVFGSDWPNAVGVSEVPDTVALVRAYFSGRSRAAAEKFFWKNSVAVYKWIRRAPEQPRL